MDDVKQRTLIAPVGINRFVLNEFSLLFLGGAILLVIIGLAEDGSWPLLQSGLRPLRLLLGLAYVLYVPGYCLTAALFPGRTDLDGIERTGLSLGLSIAWVPVLALILDRLPWGLRLWPIAWGVLISILLFSGVAIWRRARLPLSTAHVPDMNWQPRRWWGALSRLEKRIYQLCALALLLAGGAAAFVFLVPSPDEFMTEFYMLGAEGLAESYPREAAVGEELTVTMGISNLERDEQTYRVEVWVVDTWTPDRKELVSTAGPFTLPQADQLTQSIGWAMPWAGDDQQVELLLFIQDQDSTEPYRRLRLWLDVSE